MPKLQNIHRLVMVGAFGMAVAVSAAAAQRPEGDDTGQRDDDVPPASYHYGSYEECIEDWDAGQLLRVAVPTNADTH